MTIRVASSGRDTMLTALKALADEGSGPATQSVYSGSQPSSADAAPTGTLLVTFTLADPAFADPDAGVLTFDADPDITATAAASGSAGWCRLHNSNGTAVLDGTVGTSSSSDFTINTTSIVSGQPVIFASGAITFPA